MIEFLPVELWYVSTSDLLLCRMDDNSSMMQLIEIVPVDNNSNCSESPDIKLSPCHVKVCTQYMLLL